MRVSLVCAVFLASVAAAAPASATTIVVFTHPETLEKQMVVVDKDGPDKVILCMLPPGEAGCHEVKARRPN
jgi:hypothetical protein